MRIASSEGCDAPGNGSGSDARQADSGIPAPVTIPPGNLRQRDIDPAGLPALGVHKRHSRIATSRGDTCRNLLRFLREESENRQVTILYATHVLDGLVAWGLDGSQDWATHLVFLSPNSLRFFGPMRDAKPLVWSLHALCEHWMCEDRSGHHPPSQRIRVSTGA